MYKSRYSVKYLLFCCYLPESQTRITLSEKEQADADSIRQNQTKTAMSGWPFQTTLFFMTIQADCCVPHDSPRRIDRSVPQGTSSQTALFLMTVPDAQTALFLMAVPGADFSVRNGKSRHGLCCPG